MLDLHAQIVAFLQSPDFVFFAGLPSTLATESRLRMMDYACGDGLISRALKAHFGSVLGVDISSNMVERFRTSIASLGASPEQLRAVCGDFVSRENKPTDPPLPDDELRDFDLIALSMALHHMESPASALTRLAERLKPGGKLLVIGWTPIDGSTPSQRQYQEELAVDGLAERIQAAMASHQAMHTISKPDGFSMKEQDELLTAAGCRDMQWKLADEMSSMPLIPGAKSQLYWAVATKA